MYSLCRAATTMAVGELAAVQVVCEKKCFADSLPDDHQELEI